MVMFMPHTLPLVWLVSVGVCANAFMRAHWSLNGCVVLQSFMFGPRVLTCVVLLEQRCYEKVIR